MQLLLRDSPCHHCEQRREACHGSCAAYKEWRAPLDKMQDRKRKDMIVDDVVSTGRLRSYRNKKRYQTDKEIGGFHK